MEPDANGFYAMPAAPPARSYSRDRSPAVMMAPARSTSRQRRNTASSQERPTSLHVHEGARHRSYHLTGPAPGGPSYPAVSPGSRAYYPAAPMGRSLSVSYNTRPPGTVRAVSTGGDNIQVAGSSRRNSSHSRSASGAAGAAGIQYYYGGSSRTRPISYYGGGNHQHWDGSAGSYGSYEWDEWSPAPSPAPGHSPVGSYSRSPTRHPYEMPPSAPPPPINAYRPEDDIKRLEQARLELEHLKIREAEERERGRTAERRLREIRTQADADPRLRAKVSEAEKQAAIAIAQQEEYERKLAEAEARAARLERATTSQSKKPQVILQNGKPLKPALKQTVAVTQNNTEAPATATNQNMSEQAPMNPQDYQAKIPKDLISRAALVEKGLTYEEHKDYLLVKRYLSKEDIKALLDRTAEIRKQREAVERYRASQAAQQAKVQEDKVRPAVAMHTTTDNKTIQIVTMPQKDAPPAPPPPPPPVKDLSQEWEEWKAEKKAREEARAAEEAEWEKKMKANSEKFKQLEQRERQERLIQKQMEIDRAKAKAKLQRKGWF
ncbi:hypothetical protein EYR41_005434 [Orbilia oligospora]|uniref:DUF8035 domain-containing protein n=1 Tax=Orbilia oligospora TaxID=2813651 RepID=A0A7C8NS41_ORBOL|nr:hypothetical protein TWF751_003874 [Orbilia oligospora]TGJ69388.1 hypothetical protein EYR41_005434 [Orbilia oligospora]